MCVLFSAWSEAKVTRGGIMAWEPAADLRIRRSGFAWLIGNCNLLELSSFIGDRDGAERTREGLGNFYAPPIRTLQSTQINGASLVKRTLIGMSSLFRMNCSFGRAQKPLYYALKTKSNGMAILHQSSRFSCFNIRCSIFFHTRNYNVLFENRHGRKIHNMF